MQLYTDVKNLESGKIRRKFINSKLTITNLSSSGIATLIAIRRQNKREESDVELTISIV